MYNGVNNATALALALCPLCGQMSTHPYSRGIRKTAYIIQHNYDVTKKKENNHNVRHVIHVSHIFAHYGK